MPRRCLQFKGMNRQGIVRFLGKIQGPNTPIQHHDEWVSTHCPLAPWTHPKGSDRTPSFGVHIDDEGTSVFNCFTCKNTGPLPHLLKLLEKYTGEDYSSLTSEVETGEMYALQLPEWDNRKAAKKDTLSEPLRYFLHDFYEKEYDHPYLKERGILPETAEELQLRVDPDDGHGAERILFPVFDANGGFYGYTGRATDNKVEPRVRDYYGLPKRNLLLGLEHLRPEQERVVLVEGLFDFGVLFQLDLPVVASLHSTLTKAQQRILVEIGKPVVVFYDNDEAGRKGTQEVYASLSDFFPILNVKYPRVGEKGHRRNNDPANLPDDVIIKMVEEAEMI